MKKVIGMLLAVLMMLSIVSPASAAKFPDVNLYEDEITYLTDLKIINGYPNGTFGPDNNLKRIQAVQMILREMGYKAEDLNAPNPGFTDLKPGDYGYAEVAKAVELGFISGKTAANGTKFFDLNGTLTRGQMAKILTEAYDLKKNAGFTFSDVKTGHWAKDYVSRLATANITTGYQDGTFKPENKLQRKHFAVFMARQLNDAFKPVSPPPPTTGPGDGQTSNKLQITSKNLSTEIVTIKNTGTINVTMTGWKLVSVVGNQTFEFPAGFVLQAGASVKITSGNNAVHSPPNNLKWTGSYIWNNDGDAAELFDPYGKLIHRLP